MDEHYSNIRATLNQTRAEYSIAETKRDNQLLAITTTLGEVHTRSSQEFESLDSKCSLILDVVQSLMSTMTVRDETRDAVLRELQEQTEETRRRDSDHLRRKPDPYAEASQPDSESEGKFLGDIEVLGSIRRLCDLLDDGGRVASYVEVEAIIDDLQVVLKATQDQIKDPTHSRNLKRVAGLFSSAPKLAINGGGKLNPTSRSRWIVD